MSESTQMESCPRCGSPATELHKVDTGMKVIIQESGVEGADSLPNEVCTSCYNNLTKSVSKGAKLRLEQQAREKNKHMLWKSRVNLVRQARQHMQNKDFSEAAVTYEKYIRVLEIAYDLKPGQMSPEVFGKSSKSKELTVIATAYWDLLRIYDTNPNYRDRMMMASEKLAAFLPYSPIFPDVIKKAQIFQGQAKNPDIVRNFLRLVKANSPRCFVVTATYGYPEHPMVTFFREFRDRKLLPTRTGRLSVGIYYALSPLLANQVQRSPLLKKYSKRILQILHKYLSKKA